MEWKARLEKIGQPYWGYLLVHRGMSVLLTAAQFFCRHIPGLCCYEAGSFSYRQIPREVNYRFDLGIRDKSYLKERNDLFLGKFYPLFRTCISTVS